MLMLACLLLKIATPGAPVSKRAVPATASVLFMLLVVTVSRRVRVGDWIHRFYGLVRDLGILAALLTTKQLIPHHYCFSEFGHAIGTLSDVTLLCKKRDDQHQTKTTKDV